MREFVFDENGTPLELAETHGPLSPGKDVRLSDGRFARIVGPLTGNSGERHWKARRL